jgi:hypothetical protein
VGRVIYSSNAPAAILVPLRFCNGAASEYRKSQHMPFAAFSVLQAVIERFWNGKSPLIQYRAQNSNVRGAQILGHL